MALFVAPSAPMTLHSGGRTIFKIDCDALGAEDWAALAKLVARSRRFRRVDGIPAGGLAFAQALQPYAEPQTPYLPVLIVDDVLTTGASMWQAAKDSEADDFIGVVLFARGECPEWVTPIFQMDAQLHKEAKI